MAAKNLHLEHLEDEIINQGIDGGRGAINFLQGLRDMLSFVVSIPKTVDSLLQRNHSLTKNHYSIVLNKK